MLYKTNATFLLGYKKKNRIAMQAKNRDRYDDTKYENNIRSQTRILCYSKRKEEKMPKIKRKRET
jgi:hypothetical protein